MCSEASLFSSPSPPGCVCLDRPSWLFDMRAAREIAAAPGALSRETRSLFFFFPLLRFPCAFSFLPCTFLSENVVTDTSPCLSACTWKSCASRFQSDTLPRDDAWWLVSGSPWRYGGGSGRGRGGGSGHASGGGGGGVHVGPTIIMKRVDDTPTCRNHTGLEDVDAPMGHFEDPASDSSSSIASRRSATALGDMEDDPLLSCFDDSLDTRLERKSYNELWVPWSKENF
ncbi:uncharacterized protein LOC143213892 [Lasioglossum baleicum]|uniref:uncharacterized protein LOC143213892 n=1 Tax=Lasioglossum baleicum TaxID=434251 RepID=UPI003FCE38C3